MMVFGVFDRLHEGHRAFLYHARKQGSKLIAVVARDSFVRGFKKKNPVWSEDKRLAAVQELPAVDRAELADEITSSYGVIEKFKPDAIMLGYDQIALGRDLRKHMQAMSVRKTPMVWMPAYTDRGEAADTMIPAEAKRVFCGVIFDVYHWKQKMFDGTYKTFERLRRRPTVDVIATRGNKILILNQRQPARAPYQSLPGGGIHDGEAPFVAARRELLEETGYMTDDWSLVGEYFGSAKIRFHEYEYIARGVQRIARQKLDNGEKISVAWRTFDEFLQCARDPLFAVSVYLKFRMYEAMLDSRKKTALRKEIFLR